MITLEKSIAIRKKPSDYRIINAVSWQREKSDFIEKYLQKKQKYIIIATLTGFIVIGSTFGILNYYEKNKVMLYHVYLDGEKIGTVNSVEVIKNWQDRYMLKSQEMYGGVHLAPKNLITYEEEIKFKGAYNNSTAVKKLTDKAEVEANAVEILVDGKRIGVVSDIDAANSVIEKVKEEFLPKNKKSTVSTASMKQAFSSSTQIDNVAIKEKITFRELKVRPEDVVEETKIFEKIQAGNQKNELYTVEKGDTVTKIAQQFGLTNKQIAQLNPQLKRSDILQIGDQLIIKASKPLITVGIEEKVSNIEIIPYKIIYQNDNSLYVNEKRVLQTGKEGSKEVKYLLLKENNMILEEKIIGEKVLEKPTDRIILKGTKPIPEKGSGTLSWPTSGGVITSYFGPRWGSNHDGLDIARANSLNISAADHGDVVHAGWKGGYGKAIIIDHGNGMFTLYAHLSSIGVSVGDKVGKGQSIGIMGNTGNSTGTHLHFEVHVNGETRNPLNYVGI